jgi:hypothetical protein
MIINEDAARRSVERNEVPSGARMMESLGLPVRVADPRDAARRLTAASFLPHRPAKAI